MKIVVLILQTLDLSVNYVNVIIFENETAFLTISPLTKEEVVANRVSIIHRFEINRSKNQKKSKTYFNKIEVKHIQRKIRS